MGMFERSAAPIALVLVFLASLAVAPDAFGAYPFGFGLSYAAFAFSGLQVVPLLRRAAGRSMRT